MPDFIERDPATVATSVKTTYEQALGKTLLPAQPEQLLINGAAYREALMRLQIQYAAEQNLVNYAEGVHLDELAVLVGVERLAPAKARCQVKFSRATAPTGFLVPAGTRVAAQGDQIWYETLNNLELSVGQLKGVAEAQAIAPGTQFNGFAVGAINQLVDRVIGFTVANTTVPEGGAAIETDERLRRRIKLAPNQFSVAGSRGAYEFFALSADPSIIDVSAINNGPVQVEIYPLTATGLPSASILSAVQAVLSDERVRPLTDIVRVFSPLERSYSINAQITVFNDADAEALDDAVLLAAQSFAKLQRSKLGQDIVRSQIVTALSLPGVYRVDLISPTADVILTPQEWSNASSISVTVVGDSDG